MREAWWAKVLKLRRSRLPVVTVLAFTVAAAVAGLFMFILRNPDRARELGLLSAKAQLRDGTADWPTHLALLAQIVAVGGLLVFGLLIIWTFGREFSDHTAKDLMALPTSRAAVVVAKFATTGAWCLLLAGYLFGLGLAVGAALRLPGWSATIVTTGLSRLLATTVMTVALAAVFAVAASIGRGYLAAVGVMFLTVFTAQIVAALGYGHLFPWSVPATYSGVAGPEQPAAGPIGYTLVALVWIGSVATTVTWWHSADQSR
jgi:ABC-2 type transport system permease protein